MKHLRKLSVRIVAAIAIGLLFACLFTKIAYTCEPVGGAMGCVLFDKAVMHPGDLLSNKQDSLMNFSKTFMVTSLTTFTLLSIVTLTQKRNNVR
jgi:hypothetical protein